MLWASNRSAANRTLVLSTMGGLRGQMQVWIKNELQAKGPPMTRAGAAKQRAQQMSETAPRPQQISSCRVKLDKAIDQHDFGNAQRVIFPIFLE
jgi:hypothetical protein